MESGTKSRFKLVTDTLVVLVTMVIAYGQPIHEIEIIDHNKYLNLSDCLYRAHKLKEGWKEIEHAEIINIGCPYQIGD